MRELLLACSWKQSMALKFRWTDEHLTVSLTRTSRAMSPASTHIVDALK